MRRSNSAPNLKTLLTDTQAYKNSSANFFKIPNPKDVIIQKSKYLKSVRPSKTPLIEFGLFQGSNGIFCKVASNGSSDLTMLLLLKNVEGCPVKATENFVSTIFKCPAITYF